MRVVLYTGKGGVGKTTTAAATALCAARRGLRTLVASADAAHSLGDVLERRLSPRPKRIATRLDAMEIDARAEMETHWGAVRDFLVSVFRYQGMEQAVAEELALLPGAEEVTTLLSVVDQAESGNYDLVIVDCAPTDAALRLLTLPDVARGALRLLLQVQRAIATAVTPLARGILAVPLPDASVFRDADAFLYRKLRRLRKLTQGAGTSVRLVLTPERMVIEEARRGYTDLCLFSLTCDAVVMNRLLPEAAAREPFFRDWWGLQAEREAEVREIFAPLPVLRGTLQEDEVVGLEALARHGDGLFGSLDPSARLATGPRMRFEENEGQWRAVIPLPAANPKQLDVSLLDGEIILTHRGSRRRIPLPRKLAAMDLEGARYADERLILNFRPQIEEFSCV